jgi:hypothetical protein
VTLATAVRRRLCTARVLVAALGALAVSAGPGAFAAEHYAMAIELNPTMALLPADHPEGMDATVRLVELDRATPTR